MVPPGILRRRNFCVSLHPDMAKQEYIQKNSAWLAAKAQEPGVRALDKGILEPVQ